MDREGGAGARRGSADLRGSASARRLPSVRVRITVWLTSGRVSSGPERRRRRRIGGARRASRRRECRAHRAGASARRWRRRATGRRNGRGRRRGRRRAPLQCAAMISSSASGAVSTTFAPLRRIGDDRARHQRAGIEHDRAARDEIAAAHRDEIGIARAGADEMRRSLGRLRTCCR